MKQTKRASWAESWANIGAGFVINTALNVVVFPLFGFYPSASEILGIGLLYTAVAIPRGYAVRRVFEHLRVRGALP